MGDEFSNSPLSSYCGREEFYKTIIYGGGLENSIMLFGLPVHYARCEVSRAVSWAGRTVDENSFALLRSGLYAPAKIISSLANVADRCARAVDPIERRARKENV